jgi:hypothetical protein
MNITHGEDQIPETVVTVILAMETETEHDP